jgi:hypothetical protein
VTAERLKKQLSEMPANQQEIIMYGERLWPRPEAALYDYLELRSAIWLFCDLDIHVKAPNIGSKAIVVRYIITHLDLFARHELEGTARAKVENLLGVVSRISRLMARNPDGECRYPPSPKREDEW